MLASRFRLLQGWITNKLEIAIKIVRCMISIHNYFLDNAISVLILKKKKFRIYSALNAGHQRWLQHS